MQHGLPCSGGRQLQLSLNGENMANSDIIGIRTKGGLFSKVSTLLTASFIISAVGTYIGAGITSSAAIITLAIAFLVGTFVVPIMARKSTTSGIVALTGWTFVSGLFLGPSIHQYVAALGWQTVFLTYLGTGGVMAACGAVAAFSGINFGRLAGWLLVALLGLIVVGIGGIFLGMSTGVNIAYCLIGMAIFALFFCFDFWRLAREEDSWEAAIDLTMSLYLDYINFLLLALRLLGIKTKD